jgi:hypothetical protein
MRGKSLIMSCLLLALVLLSATADARIHFGPLFGVLIITQNNFSGPQHTGYLAGWSLFFPLASHFGIVAEGYARMDRFDHCFDSPGTLINTDITLLLGGGGRFYPFPGKLGIIDPYISATAGLDWIHRIFPPVYLRFNLGSNINVKGMRIIPYIEGGVLLEGLSDDRISVINITTGFLF